LATAVACLGSQASSPIVSSSFWPLTAAGGVDVGHRHLGALAQLLAERGVLAGHRPDRGDLDLREGRRRRQSERCDGSVP
jgi:hypothetical protein